MCGLRWPCPDRHYRPAPAEPPNQGRWIDNAQTAAFPQVGQASWLTLAQTWRANGGRW
ncbi:hypothetical protein [Micromonospora sp. NPDC093277]|uniref:hypothetical protein n=1 Tax=Micromonospora sp. NPDC093277 TaxID=3364291 RepID=UPI0038177CAB